MSATMVMITVKELSKVIAVATSAFQEATIGKRLSGEELKHIGDSISDLLGKTYPGDPNHTMISEFINSYDERTENVFIND